MRENAIFYNAFAKPSHKKPDAVKNKKQEIKEQSPQKYV